MKIWAVSVIGGFIFKALPALRPGLSSALHDSVSFLLVLACALFVAQP